MSCPTDINCHPPDSW